MNPRIPDDANESEHDYEEKLREEDRENQREWSEFESDPYTDEEKEQMDHD